MAIAVQQGQETIFLNKNCNYTEMFCFFSVSPSGFQWKCAV